MGPLQTNDLENDPAGQAEAILDALGDSLRQKIAGIESVPLDTQTGDMLHIGEATIELTKDYSATLFGIGDDVYAILSGDGPFDGMAVKRSASSNKEHIVTDLPAEGGTRYQSGGAVREVREFHGRRGESPIDVEVLRGLVSQLQGEREVARDVLQLIGSGAHVDELPPSLSSQPVHVEAWQAAFGAVARNYLGATGDHYEIYTRSRYRDEFVRGTESCLNLSAQLVTKFDDIDPDSARVHVDFSSPDSAVKALAWLVENKDDGLAQFRANPSRSFDYRDDSDLERSEACFSLDELRDLGATNKDIDTLIEWVSTIEEEQRQLAIENAVAMIGYRKLSDPRIKEMLSPEYKLHLNPSIEHLPQVALRLYELAGTDPIFRESVSAFKFLVSDTSERAEEFLSHHVPNPNGESAIIPSVVIYVKGGADSMTAAMKLASHLAEKLDDCRESAAEVLPRSNYALPQNPLVCVAQSSGDLKDTLFQFKINGEAPFPSIEVPGFTEDVRASENLRDAVFDPKTNGGFFRGQVSQHLHLLEGKG
jgi:hypothetical protein